MKFFIDSSVIVEGFKNNICTIEIIKLLYEYIDSFEVNFNVIVLSEVVYQLTYKRKFSIEEIQELFSPFRFLIVDEEVKEKALWYMKIYSLKPNDALILATCKRYGIKYLISIDRKDFTVPCEKEGSRLIDSAEKLKSFLGEYY